LYKRRAISSKIRPSLVSSTERVVRSKSVVFSSSSICLMRELSAD
jgi:hypothetical protein